MSEYVLELNNLQVGYKKVPLLSEVSLRVKSGEILTLVGPNGSGKTTILKVIIKQLKSMGGEVFLLGKELEEMSIEAAAKSQACVTTERPRPELMTVRELVGTGRFPYVGRLGILGEDDIKKVEEAMVLTDTLDLADNLFSELSDGQRQRVMLAKAFCQEPKLLVLDEPTTFLDIRYKLDILDLIKRMAKEKDIAVIQSLHELDLAIKVSDQIAVVDGNTIAINGTPSDVVISGLIEKVFGIKREDYLREGILAPKSYSTEPSSKIEYVLPADIEKRSFEIIGEELLSLGIVLPKEEEPITKRVIHTSADFEYASTMCYSKDAISIARELIKAGADIVTDTNMAKAGINKTKLAAFGGEVHCFMADEDVAAEAKLRQVTRATVSMERAAKLGKPVIFAVGNAPTALISLYDMMKEGKFTPAFVIGVPVGFVNVVQAKELIMATDVPYIINGGRKGGSNVAAAICNALIYGI